MVDRTVWTRLEPRPRNDDMDDSLRAPVRDPLWMLSRQWQVSEFQGEDAGSPVSVDLTVAEDDLSKIALHGSGPLEAADPIDYGGDPLESIVEREPVMSDDTPPLRLRAEAGQHFRRILTDKGYGEYSVGEFPEQFRLDPPEEPMEPSDRRYVELLTDRVLDGTAVARAIRSAIGNIDAVVADEASAWSSVSASELPIPQGGSRSETLEDCVEEFYGWYVDLYDEPRADSGSAWDPTRLEYRFSIATGHNGTESVFTAPEYRGEGIDWYSFSPAGPDANRRDSDERATDTQSHRQVRSGAEKQSQSNAGDRPQSRKQAAGDSVPPTYPDDHPTSVSQQRLLPSKVSFPGMPAPRWWQFQDGDVDLSQVTADGAGLPQLLLVEFATLFGNDWYEIPVETPIGTCSRITDLSVTDTFGISESASPAIDDDWQAFMHELPGQDEPGLLLPPTLADSVTGEPLERVVIARDEVANHAFAIERTVESPTGTAIDRTEFRRPKLEVDRISAAENPDEESVQLANPGEDNLDIDGYTIRAEMGDEMRDVYTFGQRTLDAGETLDVVTGTTGDENAASAGLSTSVWTSAAAIRVADGSDTLVATKLLASPSSALGDYRLSTDVPPYWFPFTPTGERTNRLKQSLLLDAESVALPVESIPRPQGEILGPESDQLPDGEDTYLLYEEELTRGGREVTRRSQFARWTDGAGHLWRGRETGTGDTQLDSDLRFDTLEQRARSTGADGSTTGKDHSSSE